MIANRWAQADYKAAANWLQQMPAGMERDAAVGTFVTMVTGQEPTVAFEWAESIGDLVQRTNVMHQLYDSWRKNDDAAANDWLAKTSAVGADTKEQWKR